jgi:hypothetical protein
MYNSVAEKGFLISFEGCLHLWANVKAHASFQKGARIKAQISALSN